MATSKKALAMAEDLASELTQRQSGLAVGISYDEDQNPLIRVGSGTAGAKGALIKVMPIDWPLAKDILGLPQTVYTPHKMLVAFEAPDTGVDPNTWVEKTLILGAVFQRGTRVEVYEVADAPVAASFTSANFKAAFEPSAQYGMQAGQ